MWVDDDACIKCSLCTSVCPVYAKDMQFPGPKTLGPDWWRRIQQLGNPEDYDEFVDNCTFCQLCEAACPVGVPVAHLIAEHKIRKPKPLIRKWRDYVLAHPHWIAKFPQLTKVPRSLAKALGLSTKITWPKKNFPRDNKLQHDRQRFSNAVGLLVDCYSRGFDGAVVDSARSLLELWGYDVFVVPESSLCCGAAAYAGGNRELGYQIALDMASQIFDQEGHFEILVTLNATCDSTLREEWRRYWHLSLPFSVMPFQEFALAYAPVSFWQQIRGYSTENDNLTYYVHTTCRSRVSRGSGLLDQLAEKAGFRYESLALDCCGAAGSYAFKVEHEELAKQMGMVTLNVGRLIVDSGTCALHLRQTTGLEARHPAFWLYRAYLQSKERNEITNATS